MRQPTKGGASAVQYRGFHKTIDQLDQALDYYKQALAISHEIADSPLQAAILNGIAGVYQRLANQYRADDALQLLQEGQAYFKSGDASARLARLDKALAIFDAVARSSAGDAGEGQAGGALGRALTLIAKGDVYASTDQYQDALQAYESARAVPQAGDNDLRATLLSRITEFYFKRGLYKRSIDFYQQALAIHRDKADRQNEAFTLS